MYSVIISSIVLILEFSLFTLDEPDYKLTIHLFYFFIYLAPSKESQTEP